MSSRASRKISPKARRAELAFEQQVEVFKEVRAIESRRRSRVIRYVFAGLGLFGLLLAAIAWVAWAAGA